ncbi:CbiX/SirB N-terminal domain-containing protein [Streptomyces sp. NPDC006798]|uniref:CbiX/SirB N-terminal domain-containing protein n=1 Tax=Streptomyces sp. NPDC006798 TaxID=3155462 RepID=UPI0034032DEC
MNTPPAPLTAGHGVRHETGATASGGAVPGHDTGRDRDTPPPSGISAGISTGSQSGSKSGPQSGSKSGPQSGSKSGPESGPAADPGQDRADALSAAVERTIAAALDETTAADRSDVSILLVGPGSTGRDGHAGPRAAIPALARNGGFTAVETAFVSLAAPDVPSGLDRCLRPGTRRIVVVPSAPLTGALSERLRKQTARWATDHPEVAVVTAGDPSGPEGVPGDAGTEGVEGVTGNVTGDIRPAGGKPDQESGAHGRTQGHGGRDHDGEHGPGTGLGRHGSHVHAH